MSRVGYGAPSAQTADAVLASGYTPPSAVTADVELVRSGSAYGAPSAQAADAVLVSGYTPPSATAADVVLFVPQPFPAPLGWVSSAFGAHTVTTTAGFWPAGIASTAALGTPVVYNLRQYAIPAGLAAGAFGTPVVFNLHQFVSVSSISAGAFGTPTIYNFNQEVILSGIAPPSSQVPSSVVVFDPLQYVTGVGGIAAGAFPSPYVADYYQNITLLGRGLEYGQIGTLFIAHRVRTLTVPFIYTNAFGTPTVESFLNVPDTWKSSAFGTPFVSLFYREIAHWASPPTSSVSRPTVINRNQYLHQKGWGSLEFPPQEVYNLDQYSEAGAYETNSPPGAFGTAGIANRNREVLPSGFTRGRFGNRTDTFVVNGARAIAPLGIDSIGWGAETFISHYIRYVYPESWDDLRMKRWAVVYNNAFLVQPPSIGDTSAFGRPDPVFSNQQTVRHYLGNDQSSFGTAFVAFKIRYVYPRDISFPTAFYPTVRLNPQIIAPEGIALFRPYGHVVISVFQRIASPRSTNVFQNPRVGEPWVRNRNVVVRPQTIVREAYGQARVFNRDQYILPGGLLSLRMGPYMVADRTRRVFMATIGAPPISLIHRVRNSIADPPGAQVVYPASMEKGIPPHYVLMPAPEVRHPTIYPDGWDSAKYGTAVVRTNSIYPLSIVDIDRFGSALVSGAQYVYTNHDTPWEGEGGVGRPQLSPHTIYGPPSSHATAQAKTNHPAVATLHPVTWPSGDGRWSEGDGWPWFGRPNVSTSPRYITPGNANPGHPKWGDAIVDLRVRRVYPTPIRGPRFGPVVFLNVPQDIVFDEDNPGVPFTGEFGSHTVAHPPEYPPHIYVGDNDFTEFGEHSVDLFDREILPAGIPHRGNPQEGFTNPWGTAMVGYPREYVVTAGDQTLWGTHIIEYLNRQVWPEGWDSLTLVDDSLNDFRYRMRVTRRNPVNTTSGIAATSGVGVPTVSFRIRTMVLNPIWPGYAGIPRVGMTVTPTGWEDTVFGDIDEWVAGTVKPHGDEMFRPGYPRLARGVQPAGISDGAFGGTRFARWVVVSGMPPIGFDGPSVTDEYGCSRRVVTTWPIQAPTFPTPVVTQ